MEYKLNEKVYISISGTTYYIRLYLHIENDVYSYIIREYTNNELTYETDYEYSDFDHAVELMSNIIMGHEYEDGHL